jgi:hypothetical protein
MAHVTGTGAPKILGRWLMVMVRVCVIIAFFLCAKPSQYLEEEE